MSYKSISCMVLLACLLVMPAVTFAQDEAAPADTDKESAEAEAEAEEKAEEEAKEEVEEEAEAEAEAEEEAEEEPAQPQEKLRGKSVAAFWMVVPGK
ncbi:MAG: hypothetical protein ACLFTT_06605 [Candidatus Hydrogenedentota bacterium]